jgi:hypothetical protein
MNTQNQKGVGKRRVLVTTKRRDGDASQPHTVVEQMAQSQADHRAAHRHASIAEAAYRLAEKRGFAPGYELEDWLQAELAVEAALRLSVLCPADAITPAEKASSLRQN